MSAIGERTHRWFVLFLYFTIQVSFYYTTGFFKVLIYFFKRRTIEIRFHSLFEYFKAFFLISVYESPFILTCFIWLGVIFCVLVVFFAQKICEISKNETAVEAIKLKSMREKGKCCRNLYDEGFINNWKRVLFPPTVEEHEPFKLEKNENGEYNIKFYYMNDSYYEYEYEEEERYEAVGLGEDPYPLSYPNDNKDETPES